MVVREVIDLDYATAAGDILRQVPTVSAGRAALTILLQLAYGGDVAAARTLGAALARKLGREDAVPAIEGLQSFTGVLQEDAIPPLLRLYLLAFVPRELMSRVDNAATEAAHFFREENEYAQFQRLVRRGDIMQHEALKAYCLAAFTQTIATSSKWGAAGVGAGWQNALDRILSDSKVVPGSSANTQLAIGSELILSTTADGLASALLHEMGHYLFDIMMARSGEAVSGDEAAAPCADDLVELPKVLADAIRSALSGTQERPMPIYLGRRISLLVSVSRVEHGSYMHWSLTLMGGPIPLRTAIQWVALILDIVGVSTSDTAVGHSPRGVFHFGFAREIDPDRIEWPRGADEAMQRLEVVRAAADAWLDELIGERKIGADGDSVPVGLGLREPATRLFVASPSTVQDLGICQGFESQANSVSVTDEQARQLMGVAMRCAYPALIKPLLDIGLRPEMHLHELGSSIGVAEVPGQAAKSFLGPTAAYTLAVLPWLHEQGVDLDTPIDEKGTTLLLDAVRQESAGVSVLLSLGADPNRADADGNTALHAAVGSSRRDLVAGLLQAGGAHDQRNAKGQTALALAVAIDDADAVDLLLQGDADPDARDTTGATPLTFSLSGDMARRLIASGAQPDAANHTAQTPLIVAAERGRAEVVRALLDAGADPEGADDLGFTALHFAAGGWGEPAEDCLTALLDAGAEVDEETREGVTPLMVAARAGRVGPVGLLLSRGANVDARDMQGDTPMIFALDPSQQLSRNFAGSSQTEEVARALAEKGADVNAQNDSGLSALHLAVQAFTSALVSTLLALGAAVDPRTRDGQTPLMYAAAQGHSAMVAALVDAGADVNARDDEGRTPLGYALRDRDGGQSEHARAVIEQLKARGARE